MAFRILRLCNAMLNLVTVLALLLFGSYGAYALWDNEQVLAAATDVQADMLRLKPEAVEMEEKDNSESFAELRKINPDVCGWITMEGTNIDFPVLQGKNNMAYISTDVYGKFSLAGSIFLDSRNDTSFLDAYSLLYGHHMADGNMFGDLDRYKDADFFRENRNGTLVLPRITYHLEVLACMVVSASDQRFFDPEAASGKIGSMTEYAMETGVQLQEAALHCLGEKEQLLALSTCSTEFTDARTIVLARMIPAKAEEKEG